MYNTDFLPQIEEFQRYLFGSGCVDVRAAVEEASKKPYFPPKDLEIVRCHEDTNGEFVPDTALGGLETEICSE